MTSTTASKGLALAAAAALAVADDAGAAGTQSPAAPEVVYDWSSQRCDANDIADAPVRAFRNAAGAVRLVTPHVVNRALVGPSLDAVKHHCEPIFRAAGSADPSSFDDAGWLEAVHTEDGRTVFGLVSLDYHPQRHGLACATARGPQADDDCWYNAIIAVRSDDGGRSFTRIGTGSKALVIGPRRRFDAANPRKAGAFAVSNIVRSEGWYYVMVSVAGDGAQAAGECLLRTRDLARPDSWLAWDGRDFSVFARDPYAEDVPLGAACAPLPSIARFPVRSLLRHGRGFLIATVSTGAEQGVSVQSSADLIHWSAPITLLTVPIYSPGAGQKGTEAFYYPSLIDPNSQSPSFDSFGQAGYVYMARYHYGAGLDRDLVRFRVTLPER